MLSPRERAQFEEEGYLRLGHVLSDEGLTALSERMDDIMLGHYQYPEMDFQLDGGGAYNTLDFSDMTFRGPRKDYRKIQRLDLDPVFMAYIKHPRIIGIARQLIGEDIAVYRSMFMNKPAQRGTVLPYHQDGGTGWGLSRDPLMTLWTALDPATRANGCVQIIPGSHKLGLLSEKGHTITPEQTAQYAPEEKSVYLEAEAGEAILLHNFTLHTSGVNTTDIPRRAFSACYMDAATRYIGGGRSPVFVVVHGKAPAEAEAAVTA